MSILRSIQSKAVRRGVWLDKTSDLSTARSLIRDLRPMTGLIDLIRLGAEKEGDGGYLVPDDLQGIAAAVSPGVSTECSFDLALAERGIPVHMADASVVGPPIRHDLFRFSKVFLDTYKSDLTITLADFVENIEDGDLLLQMDIEGAEWRVINSTPEDVLARFRIIVLECHDLVNIFSRFGIREINAAFRKILCTHNVVHIHPNNVAAPIDFDDLVVPSLMEFTFHRKDRDVFSLSSRGFPHPLDIKNIGHLPDIVLPHCWRH